MFAHSRRAWAIRVLIAIAVGSIGFIYDRTTTTSAIADTLPSRSVAQPIGPHTPQDIGSEWQPFVPGVIGYVSAIAHSGTDLYIGGHFTQVGGVKANNIARWNTVTHQWSALGSGISGPGYNPQIRAIVVNGSDVYIGGDFDTAGGVTANYIARWDTTTNTWHTLGSGISNGLDRPVQTLVVSGNTLYVGGQFSNAGGAPARGLAAWNINAQTWNSIGNGVENGVHGYVFALALNGSDLYVGGGFDRAGTITATNVARWNTSSSTWFALGRGTNNDNYPYVQSMIMSGTQLYIGGQFTSVSDGVITTTVNNVAAWSTTQHTWSALGAGLSGVDVFTGATSLALGPNGVYVTGHFTQAGSTPVHNIARWTGSQWLALQNPIESFDGLDNDGEALLINGGDVYVGGIFNNAGIRSALSLARWNITEQNWYALGNGVNSYLTALAVSGDDVYLGGDFTSAGGLTAGHIAHWNRRTQTWSNLDGGVSGCRKTGGACDFPSVDAIIISGTDVYVGGNFSSAGGVPANSLARWDTTTNQWFDVGNGVNCSTSNCSPEVRALFADATGLYVGGTFDTAGGSAAHNVARWNGSIWSNLGSGVNGAVYAITRHNSVLYVGGGFTSPAPYLAAFDGANWSGVGASLNNLVEAITFASNDLYVGGQFTNAGGAGANYLARLINASGTWQELYGNVNNPVYALTTQGSRVIIGGAFTQAGGLATNYIAQWDTGLSQWSALNYGFDAVVRALTADSDNVYVGGDFTTADDLPTDYFTRWGAGQAIVGGFAASDPDCVGVYGNYIGCVVRGADDHVWLKEYANGTWSQWIRINVDANQTIKSGPSITAWGAQTASGRPARLNIFARADNDYVLNATWDASTGWTLIWRWYPGAPLASSNLDCASWAADRIDCFYLDSNNTMNTLWISGTQLYGFGGLGGVFTSGPGVSTWGVGRYDVFGRGTDDLLYHDYYENSWSGFIENFSGVVTSDPDCVSRNTHLIDCVVRGPNDAALLLSYTGSGWTSYSSLGNVLRSGPTIASLGPNNLNVMAWGQDCHLYQRIWANGIGWSAWSDLGGDARVTGLCYQDFLPIMLR